MAEGRNMKYQYAVKDGIPIVCKKHTNETMRISQSGFMFCATCKRNAVARQRNEMLSLVCGCSARQAKIDMGI